MNPFQPRIIIESIRNRDRARAWKRFPVATQLGILSVLLGSLFITLLWPDRPATAREDRLPPNDAQPAALASVAIVPLEDVRVAGKAAFVYDVRTDTVLYEKNEDEVLPLASITKLMTSLVAAELLSPEETVTVSKRAVSQDGPSGLRAGDEVQASELRKYAMVASSNDAAFSLGTAVGEALGTDDPNGAFTAAMNIRAEELGWESMKFYNPTGLDITDTQAGGYGSAREVSYLLAYILKEHPDILDATTKEQTEIALSGDSTQMAENTNPLITKIPNLLGSKTGYTNLAGGNLTIAFDAGYDRPIIVTVLGSTYNDRFSDVMTLVDAVVAATELSE